MRRLLLALMIVIPAAAPGARAGDFTPREFNVGLSGGESPMNFHGHSVWRSIHFELAGDYAFVKPMDSPGQRRRVDFLQGHPSGPELVRLSLR